MCYLRWYEKNKLFSFDSGGAGQDKCPESRRSESSGYRSWTGSSSHDHRQGTRPQRSSCPKRTLSQPQSSWKICSEKEPGASTRPFEEWNNPGVRWRWTSSSVDSGTDRWQTADCYQKPKHQPWGHLPIHLQGKAWFGHHPGYASS